MLECSALKVSSWKVGHPSDTEDETLVGLSSEDEAEGLVALPGVARWRSSGPAVVPGSTVHHPAAEDGSPGKEEGLEAGETTGVVPSSRGGPARGCPGQGDC